MKNEKLCERYWPWIIEALERDAYTCIDCGSKENVLVHHIDESRKTGELNNTLSNLATLCRYCHARRHHLTTVHREDVIELREAGLNFRQIGEKLGFTKQRAHQIYSPNYRKQKYPFPRWGISE